MQQPDFDLPDPPGIKPVSGWIPWRLIVGIVVAAGVIAAAIWVPIPLFYAYQPGPIRDISGLMEIEGAPTYSSEGVLFMTTVSVDTSVTTVEWIATIFDPARQIVSKDSVTRGRSLDDVREEQAEQMLSSQDSAEVVALTALGFGTSTGIGVEVAATVAGSPAEPLLEPGDLIERIDGVRADNRCDVGRVIAARRPGDRAEITVRRAGRAEVVDVDTTTNPRNPSVPFVGIVMQDRDYRFETDVEVEFDTGRVAGPSAGLMFSLGLYDYLSPGDLTGGRTIAGTGTIDCSGVVGPIGGVEQKVVAAEREGADVFLAPAGNAAAAEGAARDIEVVSIGTFDDALGFLEADTG